MTRFAWLQSRTQTLISAGLLTVLAAGAAVTGVQLAHLYASSVASCHSGCALAVREFGLHQAFLQRAFDVLIEVTPPLLGVFWGAPLLARELETGTYRLAWTQGVTRSRWLLTKLAVGAAATGAVAGVLTLTITWWYRSLDHVGTNPYAVFDRRDIAPIGYALFAFAAGALLGAVIRRTVPAMAATLVGYVAARLATASWVRPHLLAPLHMSVSLLNAGQLGFLLDKGSATLVATGSGPANSWTLSSYIADRAGHAVTSSTLATFVRTHCPAVAAPPPPAGALGGHASASPGPHSAFDACQAQAAHLYHLVVTYEPASRYWTLQWMETGVFLGLALACVAGCYYWVTRRTR